MLFTKKKTKKQKQKKNTFSEPIRFNTLGFPDGSNCEEFACNAEDLGSIPKSRRSPGERNGYPLQNSCLENLMDRGAW